MHDEIYNAWLETVVCDREAHHRRGQLQCMLLRSHQRSQPLFLVKIHAFSPTESYPEVRDADLQQVRK